MSQTEVQLIKDAVIVNADISNSAAIDVSKISGAMPLTGGTFTDDVTFDGATAGRDILFDRSNNFLKFKDNAKISLGTDDDANIYYDGTNPIFYAGTNTLRIVADNIHLEAGDFGDEFLRCLHDGAVVLYYDNSAKLSTSSTGISVTGNVSATTFSSINLSASVNEIKWPQDGSASNSRNFNIIGEQGQYGVLDVKYANARDENPNEKSARFIANGGVELYHNNVKKFETTSTGATVTGTISASGAILSGNQSIASDSAKLFLGASNDLEIFHSGSHSFIQDVGTGDLKLRGSEAIKLEDSSSGKPMITCTKNFGTEIYHQMNSAVATAEVKFATTSTGVTISGNNSNGNFIKGVTRFCPSGTTTVKAMWDETGFSNAGHFQVKDGVALTCGDSSDLRIFHDGTDNIYGSNGLKNHIFKPKDTDVGLKIIGDGAVEAYYDNSKKFETTSDGTKTSGQIKQFSADGNTSFRRDVYYLAIPTNSSRTITLTSLNGTGVFRAGGYTNAGQGALALHILFGGAMFATQHYQVNELINSGMQNTSISTSKNSTNYTIAITNSSNTFSLILQIYLESTGTIMGYAVS